MYSFIIPFFNAHQLRYTYLITLLNYLREQCAGNQIIVVEQGNTIPSIPQVDVLHIDNNGKFNKNKCINTGARHASFHRIVIHDADILFNKYQATTYFNKMNLSFNGHLIYRITDEHFTYEKGPNLRHQPYFSDYRYVIDNYQAFNLQRDYLLFKRVANAGGSLLVDKDMFIEVGGANEQWNFAECGSDVELVCRLQYFAELHGLSYGHNSELNLIHLPHPREPRRIPNRKLQRVLSERATYFAAVKAKAYVS